MKKIILGICLLLAGGCSANAAPPNPTDLYAWYREDGIVARGTNITAWNNAATGSAIGDAAKNRVLNEVIGKPQVARVQTPGGTRKFVSFDGTSALWKRVSAWGTLGEGRTIVIFARLPETGEGFLFDGTTGAGLSRAQVRGGNWQVGVQPTAGSATAIAGNADQPTHAAKFGVWQTHAISFRPNGGGITVTHTLDGAAKTVQSNNQSSLAGIILGSNGAAKNGLRAEVAEVLVYDRAISGDELTNATTYLKEKWGAPTRVALVGETTDTSASDLASIQTKLADSTKPLIWLFTGVNSADKTQGTARNEAQHFAERVRWEMNRRRDIVINTGVATDTPAAMLKDFDTRVARFRPAVVVLTPATGDNVVPDNAAIISRIRKLGAIPIVQATATNVAIAKQIASENKTLLVDASGAAEGAQTKALAAGLFRTFEIADAKSATNTLVNTAP